MQKPESYLLKRGAESSTTLTVADAVPLVVKKEVMKVKGSPAVFVVAFFVFILG